MEQIRKTKGHNKGIKALVRDRKKWVQDSDLFFVIWKGKYGIKKKN